MTTETTDPTHSDNGAPAPAVEPPALETEPAATTGSAAPTESAVATEPGSTTAPANGSAPEASPTIETAPEARCEADGEPVAEPAAETAAPADEPASTDIGIPKRHLGADYRSDRRFSDFPISPEVLQGVTALGYDHATPIQARAIEPALAGKDLLLRAKTGTGKTAAFGVPVIDRIPAGTHQPRALILAPTRELALQVAQELTAIARFKDIGVCAIYGGVGFGPQEQALRDGVEIVVGTPGRLLDHVKRGNLKLETVNHIVLDEADEMLSMGFAEDVRKLLDRTNPVRQAIFCSATLNDSVRSLIDRYSKDPEEIYLSADGDNVALVEHLLYESSPDYHKARALLDVLEISRPTSAIIFCNTKDDVGTVYNYLDRQGLSAEMLTGDLPQSRREHVMARIKAGAVQYLVATDVAARGIDISDLSHVINYALPDDAPVYLHRAGRTGRIGKKGVCISLAGGADFSSRLSLERIHKIKFDVRPLPTPEESANLRADRLVRMLKEAMNTMVYESYLDLVHRLRDRPDGDHILAAAFRAFVMWDRDRRIAAADALLDGELGGDERRRDEPRREDRGERRERRDDRGDRGERRERRDAGPRDGERRDERADRPREGERREERADRPRDGERREERADRPRDGERREERADRPRDGERREERADRPRDGERREDRGERRDDRGERRDSAPREGERRDRAPREGERRERGPRDGDRREERGERRDSAPREGASREGDRRERRERPPRDGDRGPRREAAPREEGAPAEGARREDVVEGDRPEGGAADGGRRDGPPRDGERRERRERRRDRDDRPRTEAPRAEGAEGATADTAPDAANEVTDPRVEGEGAPMEGSEADREAGRRPRRRRRRRSAGGADAPNGENSGEAGGSEGVDSSPGHGDTAEDG